MMERYSNYETETTLVRLLSAVYSIAKLLEACVSGYDDSRELCGKNRIFTTASQEAETPCESASESQTDCGTTEVLETPQTPKEREEKPLEWHNTFLASIIERWGKPRTIPYSTMIAEYRHSLKSEGVRPLDRSTYVRELRKLGYIYNRHHSELERVYYEENF